MGYKRKEYENMENLFTNGKKKIVKYEEGAAMYFMGIHAFTELAKEAKAIYRMPEMESLLDLVLLILRHLYQLVFSCICFLISHFVNHSENIFFGS